MHKCPHHRLDVFWQEDTSRYMKVDSLPRPEPHGQAPTFLLPSYHSLTQGLPVFLFILFFFFFTPKSQPLLSCLITSRQRVFLAGTGIAHLSLLSGVYKSQKGSGSLDKVPQAGRTSRRYSARELVESRLCQHPVSKSWEGCSGALTSGVQGWGQRVTGLEECPGV